MAQVSLLVPQLSSAQSVPAAGPVDTNYPSLFTPVFPNSQPGSNVAAPKGCLTESDAAKGARADQMEAGSRMTEVSDWEGGMRALNEYINAGAAAARHERVADDVCSRNCSDFTRH